jgi:hypothetical protein
MPKNAVTLEGKITFTKDGVVRVLGSREWCSWPCFVDDLIEILKEEKIVKTKTKD